MLGVCCFLLVDNPLWVYIKIEGSFLAPRPLVNSKKGWSFKLFMARKVTRYEGSRDSKVSMKWITTKNRVFRSSGSWDDQKVINSSQLHRGQALIRWERVYQILGDDFEVNISWYEFLKQIKLMYFA